MKVQKQPLNYFSPKEVAKAMAGRRTAVLETTRAAEVAVTRERVSRYQGLEGKIEELRKSAHQWQENLGRLTKLRESLER